MKMKHKVKSMLSIVLALSMGMSSFSYAFAQEETPDDTEYEVTVDDQGDMTVEEVVEEPAEEEASAQEEVLSKDDAQTLTKDSVEEVEVSYADDTETITKDDVSGTPADIVLKEKESDKDGFKKVNIKAQSASDETSEFRIYFWKYDGTTPDDPDKWSTYFTTPYDLIDIEGLDDFAEIDMPYSGGYVTGSLMDEKSDDGSVKSVFLDFSMKAGATMDTDIYVGTPESVDVMLEAVSLEDSETTLDYLPLKWEDNEAVISADDVVIEDEVSSDETEAVTEDIDDEFYIEEDAEFEELDDEFVLEDAIEDETEIASESETEETEVIEEIESEENANAIDDVFFEDDEDETEEDQNPVASNVSFEISDGGHVSYSDGEDTIEVSDGDAVEFENIHNVTFVAEPDDGMSISQVTATQEDGDVIYSEEPLSDAMAYYFSLEPESDTDLTVSVEFAKAVVEEKTFDFENLIISIVNEDLPIDTERGTLATDSVMHLFADDIGLIEPEKMAVKAQITIPDGIVLPKSLKVSGNKIKDQDGTAWFELNKVSGNDAEVKLDSVKLSGNVVTIDLTAEGQDDLFGAWQLALIGSAFEIEDFETEESDDSGIALLSADAKEETEEDEIEIDIDPIKLSFDVVLSLDGYDDITLDAESEIRIGTVEADENEIDTLLSEQSSIGLPLDTITNYDSTNYPLDFKYNGAFTNSLSRSNFDTTIGAGMGTEYTGTNPNYDGMTYFRVPKKRADAIDSDAYIQFDNCYAYTNSSGKTTTYDCRIYFWAPDQDSITNEGVVVFTSTGRMQMSDYSWATNANTQVNTEAYLNSEFHFYTHGSTTDQKVGGHIDFRDLDVGEGYNAVSGEDKTFVFSGSYITQSSSSKTEFHDDVLDRTVTVSKPYYNVGTVASDSDDLNTRLYVAYDNSDLNIRLSYVSHKHASGIYGSSYTITPHWATSTVPSSVSLPDTVTVGWMTNTTGMYDTMFPQMSAAGYLFNGWYTDSSLTTKYTGTSSTQSNTNIYASWTKLYGDLQLTKSVSPADASKNNTFVFTLSGTSTAGDTVNLSHTFTGAGTYTFSGVPVGTYTLTETSYDSSLWTSSSTSRSVTISANTSTGAKNTTSVTVTNTARTGSLTVTKEIDGIDASAIDSTLSLCKFTFNLKGTSDIGTSVDKTVTISGAGKATISDIPVGTYTLTETFDSDYWECESSSKTVTITADTTASVSFKNTIKTYTLQVQKNVIDPSGTITDLSGFEYELTGNTVFGTTFTQTAITNANGIATFEKVPAGSYKVTEKKTNDSSSGIPDWWDTYQADASFTLSGDMTVNVTNIYETGNLEVTKTIEKADDEKYNKEAETRYNESLAGFAFHLYGYSDSGILQDLYAVTNDSGVATFENVPVGTKDNYVITEVSADDVKKASDNGNASAQAVVSSATQSLIQYVENDSWSVSINYNETTHVQSTTKSSLHNTLLKWRITVYKTDAEMEQQKVSQQEATLKGAVYGLYDGDDFLVDKYVTDENGSFTTDYYVCGDHWYLQELQASEGYLIDDTKYYINCAYEDVDSSTEYHDVYLSLEKYNLVNSVYEYVMKGAYKIYKLGGDTNETDKEWLTGSGFSIYSVEDLAEYYGVDFMSMNDDDIIQWLFDNVRDEYTLDYSSIIGVKTATVYAQTGDDDILNGYLSKSYTYANGTTITEDTGDTTAYIVPELTSDNEGIVQTPRLPYGRYILIETTVPSGRTAAAPRVLTIDSDDQDKEVKGDGLGTPNGDIALWDKDITAYVKMIKVDDTTGQEINTEGAEYVLHDVDGAYFDWYMEDKTTTEKNNYKNSYGDLVVDLSANYMGSYDNPYTTEKQYDRNGNYLGTYIRTTQLLPQGTYILEEVNAPEPYILQGYEGLYRTDKNGDTIWEIEDHTMEKWTAFYKVVTSDDDGIWVKNTEKASSGARVMFDIGTDALYNSDIGAFMVTAKQSNDPGVGKLSVYAEGEYVSGYANTGSTITDRVSSDFPGYTTGTDDLGNDVSTFKNTVFDYETDPIKGSVFKVYANEDIYSNEGEPNSTLLFKKGALVTTLTTDGNGEAWTEEILTDAGITYYGLPIGKYTVQEVTAGYGFSLSEENATPREFEITYDGQTVPIVYRDEDYTNPRQEVDLSIAKYDLETEGMTAGAVFGLYTAEDILGYDGSVVMPKDTLVALSETDIATDGSTTMADFIIGYTHYDESYNEGGLPLGQYYVKEVNAPKGYYTTNTIVNVDATYNDDQRATLVFTNSGYDDGYKFVNEQTKLLINLMDYDTEVELDGATIVVEDSEGNTMETVITVHNGTAVVRGLELDETYTIVEIQPREGYGNTIYVKDGYTSTYAENGTTIDGMDFDCTDLTLDSHSGNSGTFTILDCGGVQVVNIFNKYVQAVIEITKTGEVPSATINDDGTLGELTYTVQGLPGAEYDIITADVISHPDGYSADIYQAGVTVEHLVTDDTGKATSGKLFLGKYDIVETKAPSGYSRELDNCTISIDLYDYYMENFYNKEDYSVENFTFNADFYNERQMVDIGEDPDDPANPNPNGDPDKDVKGMAGVYKVGVNAGDEYFVEGAEFTLYAYEDIVDVFGNVVIPAGTEIEKAVSGSDGLAMFKTDLPLGMYVAKETDAPYGYYSSDAEIIFDLTVYADDDEVQVIRETGTIKNPITRVFLFLEDDMTKNELAGATLVVTDSAGNTFDTIITENTEGDGYLILGLDPDEEYTITEIIPRDGYTWYIVDENGDPIEADNYMHITIPDVEIDADLTNVPDDTYLYLYNMFVTGHMNLTKDGEVLTDAEIEEADGDVETLFGYTPKQLEGVEFTVYAVEDIYHPDGVTGLIYHAGDLVNVNVRTTNDDAIELTDENGLAFFNGMYLGQYVVKETSTPYGYAKNDIETEFTLRYKDYVTQDVEAEEGLISYINIRQKVSIQVTKHDEEDPDTVLEGAKFGLFTSEDIVSDTGDLLIPADTLIETAVTGEDGIARFVSDLPLGFYYIEELEAPLGYTSNPARIIINASYQDDGRDVIEIAEDFYNEITKVEIEKTDTDTGEPVAGATLAVIDPYGNTVDTWVTDGEIHLIKGLLVGETYTLVETSPASGYATAEPVTFTVLDRAEDGTYEPQRVLMQDPPIIITVTAVDMYTEEILDGVIADVYDEDGNLVYSDVSLEWIQKYIPIGTYVVDVTVVPDGYVHPDPTTIVVEDTPEMQEFVIPIDHIKEKTHVVDKDTGEHVDDVLANVYDKDGNLLHENVTLDWIEEYLPEGDYIIEITHVPDGYVTPDPYDETLIETGDWQEFEIPLDHIKVDVIAVDEDTDEPVDGVKANIYDEDGNLLYEDVDLEWAKEYLPKGNYTIEITEVPEGYVVPDEPTEITVIETGEWQNFEIPLDHIKVDVIAVDEETGEPLDGVKANIYDEDGNLLYEDVDLEWAMEYLPAGHYTIEVTEVPDGYIIPDPFEIDVIETGEWQNFEIPLKYIVIEISKIDSETGEFVSGAKLELTDEDEEVYDSWTTTDEAYVIEKIPEGEYTLTEKEAPNGYATAEPMTITVEAVEETQSFEMEDDPIVIEINKLDSKTGSYVSGAKLELTDANGTVVDSWTTAKSAHVIERIPAGEYTLTETQAPNGYNLADPIKITVEDTNEKQSFDMLDEPIEAVPVEGEGPKGTVQTGDDFNMLGLMLSLAVVALLAGFGYGFSRKRKA